MYPGNGISPVKANALNAMASKPPQDPIKLITSFFAACARAPNAATNAPAENSQTRVKV